ncbi:YdcF family protein [Paraburkholderia sp. J94]|uniref:YdcF family protein n=1 Tax=Paraburkholderia sp. J94 TaxID=2805441 RepID=UPI002AB2868C|nr:YdcF family protein [Paraburkholderia sp. J94]
MLISIVWALAALAIDASGLATPAAPSELGAIFGNGLEADGTPATLLAERLDAGLDCYRAGRCKRLFISGSLDGPGLDETLAMQNYLIQHGVEPHDIVPDRAGDNTLASAQHLIAYMRERHLGSVTLVSQYYHLPRARLAVTRAGGDAFAVYGVYPRTFHLRDLYASWREVPAWLVYRVRLGANPDAQPVTIRPFLSLFNLIRSLFTGEAADVPNRAPNYAPSPPSVPAWKT